MITNIVPLKTVIKSNRWNAEYFINSETAIESSANYEIVKIGDLVSERKEFLVPRDYAAHCFNYVGLENITQNTRAVCQFEPKLGADIKSRSKIFRSGDILYGRLRPTLNKALLIDDVLNEGICSTEIFVLVPNEDLVDPNYLTELLISKIVLERVGSITAGAALPRMQIKDFLNLDIPLIPLKRQKEIAQKALNVRLEAQKQISEANFALSSLPNAFIDSIKSGAETVELTEFKVNSKLYQNPLPEGDFTMRKRKKV